MPHATQQQSDSENARPENGGPNVTGWKMQDRIFRSCMYGFTNRPSRTADSRDRRHDIYVAMCM